MSEELAEDDQPVAGDTVVEVGRRLDAGCISFVVQDIIDETERELEENLRAIRRVLPYLSGLYYADQQRRFAEAKLFLLQSERAELENRINKALAIMPELLYPIAAFT